MRRATEKNHASGGPSGPPDAGNDAVPAADMTPISVALGPRMSIALG